MQAVHSDCASKPNANIAAVVREMRAIGIGTLAGIARTLQARGVKTPRGRVEWQPVQVSRLLAA